MLLDHQAISLVEGLVAYRNTIHEDHYINLKDLPSTLQNAQPPGFFFSRTRITKKCDNCNLINTEKAMLKHGNTYSRQYAANCHGTNTFIIH